MMLSWSRVNWQMEEYRLSIEEEKRVVLLVLPNSLASLIADGLDYISRLLPLGPKDSPWSSCGIMLAASLRLVSSELCCLGVEWGSLSWEAKKSRQD